MNDIEFRLKTTSDLATIKSDLKHIIALQEKCPIDDIRSRVDKLEPRSKTNRMLSIAGLTTFLAILLNIIFKGG